MAVGWAPPGLCGLLVETVTTNHIFFTQQPSLLAQATTIIHECGHILIPDLSGGPNAEVPAGLADLVTDEVQAVHGRTGFRDDIEATVELLASMVLSRACAGEFDSPPVSASSKRLVERFG